MYTRAEDRGVRKPYIHISDSCSGAVASHVTSELRCSSCRATGFQNRCRWPECDVQVINSVLMDGVIIGEHSHIQNSIVCRGTHIHDHASLRNCQARPCTLQLRAWSVSGCRVWKSDNGYYPRGLSIAVLQVYYGRSAWHLYKSQETSYLCT